MKKFFFILLLIPMLGSCSTFQVEQKLQDTTKAYGIAVRWKNFESADLFAAPSIREAFRKGLENTANIQVVDYQIIRAEYDEKNKQAAVDAQISYYLLASNRVRTIIDKQTWLYAEEKGSKRWQLTTLPPEFK